MTSTTVRQHTQTAVETDRAATVTDDSVVLADLCEEFARQTAEGMAPTVDEYIQRHPELASKLAVALPAVVMFGEIGDTPTQKKKEVSAPRSIAGCQIVRRLGTGGMGVVYEATHPKVSRRMAIKTLNARGNGSPLLRNRFLREAEAASRLNHSNIVPFLDYGLDGEIAYLSMLHIDGFSLDRLLMRHLKTSKNQASTYSALPRQSRQQNCNRSDFIACDFQKIARLGADVASALNHAHDLGTIHRDIKPANLILDSAGKIWITDFGLAKLRDDESDLSKTGDMIGTPRYMAPEQIRGISDERSDVYSLGVTLYELASGQRAWSSVDKKDLITVRAAFELPELSEIAESVPDGLANIIMKACAHQPDERYQSAAELQHVLTRFAHGASVSDRREIRRDDKQRVFLRLPFLLGAFVSVFIAGAVCQHQYAAISSPTASPTFRQASSAEKRLAYLEGIPQFFHLTRGQRRIGVVIPTIAQHAETIEWWIAGGADAAMFDIDGTSGELRFSSALRNSLSAMPTESTEYRIIIGMRSETALEQTQVTISTIDSTVES